MASIEEILASMDKDTRKGFKMSDEVTIEQLETPSLALTRALDGGWVFGRQNMIWGSKSAGKTTFVLQQIALAQRAGKSCAYFDVEKTYDPDWAARLGVDTKQLIYVDAVSMNVATDKTIELMQHGIDVLVWDSITALIPPAYEDKAGETKKMAQTGAMGALARGLSDALPMINKANEHTMFLLVSQSRNAPKGGSMWGAQHTGGTAPTFYSSAVVKLFSSDSKDKQIMELANYHDLLVERPVGRPVDFQVQYNKRGPQGMTGKYDLFYVGDLVGIDTAGELLDIGVEYGVVRKAGAWYYYKEDKLGNGRAAAAKTLRDNGGIFQKVRHDLGRDGAANTDQSASD